MTKIRKNDPEIRKESEGIVNKKGALMDAFTISF